MAIFKFDKTILSEVIAEIKKAKKFIKIAIFQLHNQEIFEELNKKLSESVKVHIITLPYDSINDDVRERVENSFQKLINSGAIVNFIKWNVGDPERTTTAVGRWYAFHGKFMVTDKTAVALSANLIDQNELDAVIKFEDDKTISIFLAQFDYLLNTFVKDNGQNLRNLINNAMGTNNHELFRLPRVIQNNIHRDFWVTHYPSSLCNESGNIKNTLYITPFQFRARTLYEKIINDAKDFVYISTESFTDQEFTKFLIRTILSRGIDVKILSGATSMDFSDRLNRMLKELLANKVEIRTTEDALHCKLLITDNRLVLGSVNLNQMNLGFSKTSRFWRANTESLLIDDDKNLLKQATQGFLSVFNKAKDVREGLAGKQVGKIGVLLSRTFNLRSSAEVKSLFAKLIIHHEIEAENFVYRLARIMARVSELARSRIVSKDDFLRAVVLYYLSERKHDKQQLAEKLSVINAENSIKDILSWLVEKKLIEKQDDFYKIKIEKLLA